MAKTPERCMVVSNRLPITYDESTQNHRIASGGLVTSLLGVANDVPITWFGVTTSDLDVQQIAPAKNLPTDINVIPIVIAPEVYELYYNGFCNAVLWPLLHYEQERVVWQSDCWHAYQQVNKTVAAAIADQQGDQQIIWVHDFHLMLVASYLRKIKKRQSIGFFLHVPFPSYEIFRQLPCSNHLLQSLLAFDLIGFHDYSYLMHFSHTIQYALGLTVQFNRINAAERIVDLGVYPVSIPTQAINKKARSAKTDAAHAKHAKRFAAQKIVLGVDRLDYIKGLDLKLEIFQSYLEKYPEQLGKLSLLQIVVPSRTDVSAYIELKKLLEQKVADINAKWGKGNYQPIHYIYDSVAMHELLALFRLSSCLLITSKRDGMNLVALEYVAAQAPAHSGQILLSEFAGAISIMPNAIAINPWHTEQVVAKLHHALTNPAPTSRNKQMYDYLRSYSSKEWAKTYLTDLKKSAVGERKLTSMVDKGLISKIKNWRHAYLFLDYDGTLVPICDEPEQALIATPIADLLAALQAQGMEVLVISGRSRKFLWQQFKRLHIRIVAEHGAEYYDCRAWRTLVSTPIDSWFYLALQIMHHYGRLVPSSFVEVKKYSICWHYRNSPVFYADYQARKLMEELEFGLASFPVQISSGKKIIEVKAMEADKGKFYNWFSQNVLSNSATPVVACGDDRTDEDLFIALRPDDISIKVGMEETKARYRLRAQQEVVEFLRMLVD
ncbi:MAG: bifunctional alpha,alpha-trehalose-phosphate synthase (UDP-forming)/trehalose-phosphatase [Pseudomonadota bacterium]|nr:bifunctional alpha,alpha-trehalose-phosphate synthase (UDP-forming)/trehalose-phosphatase [Pseudomonadota bacterium]